MKNHANSDFFNKHFFQILAPKPPKNVDFQNYYLPKPLWPYFCPKTLGVGKKWWNMDKHLTLGPFV